MTPDDAREIRAEAAELLADESFEVMRGLFVASVAADPWSAMRGELQDWLHGWAAKFRDGAT